MNNTSLESLSKQLELSTTTTEEQEQEQYFPVAKQDANNNQRLGPGHQDVDPGFKFEGDESFTLHDILDTENFLHLYVSSPKKLVKEDVNLAKAEAEAETTCALGRKPSSPPDWGVQDEEGLSDYLSSSSVDQGPVNSKEGLVMPPPAPSLVNYSSTSNESLPEGCAATAQEERPRTLPQCDLCERFYTSAPGLRAHKEKKHGVEQKKKKKRRSVAKQVQVQFLTVAKQVCTDIVPDGKKISQKRHVKGPAEEDPETESETALVTFENFVQRGSVAEKKRKVIEEQPKEPNTHGEQTLIGKRAMRKNAEEAHDLLKCTECKSYSSWSPDILGRHRSYFHGEPPKSEQPEEDVPKSASMVQCPECDKYLATNTGLKIHRTRMHRPEAVRETLRESGRKKKRSCSSCDSKLVKSEDFISGKGRTDEETLGTEEPKEKGMDKTETGVKKIKKDGNASAESKNEEPTAAKHPAFQANKLPPQARRSQAQVQSQCLACEFSHNHRQALSSHLCIEHPKPWQCPACSHRFGEEAELSKHENDCHMPPIVKPSSSSAAVLPPPRKCFACHKEYKTESDLDFHLKVCLKSSQIIEELLKD